MVNDDSMELPLVVVEMPNLPLFKRGKTKDLFVLDQERLLMVYTDRVRAEIKDSEPSNSPIAGRGRVLHTLSAYWFDNLKSVFPNHLLSPFLNDLPVGCEQLAESIDGRSMIVHKTPPLPFKCIVCGYLSESVWDEYRHKGTVLGYRMPEGMCESQRLPAPLFGAAVKPVPGCHGELLDFSDIGATVGKGLAEEIREGALRLFMRAWKKGREREVLLVEALFSFGVHEDEIILIDECLTTDTSRFWAKETYSAGVSHSPLDPREVLRRLVE